MFERSSTSQERDVTDNLRSKRTASAQGLNVTTEGRTIGLFSAEKILKHTVVSRKKLYVYD